METSFLELRCKHVINVTDGRSLGHIVDVIIDIRTSRVLGLVVPGYKGFFNMFKNTDDIFIPYCNICKIGEDTILVELLNLPYPKKNRKTVRLLNKNNNTTVQNDNTQSSNSNQNYSYVRENQNNQYQPQQDKYNNQYQIQQNNDDNQTYDYL